jgi:hypothetical protein
MSPKTHSKNAGKSCYRGRPFSAGGSNGKSTVTRWTSLKLREEINTNKNKALTNVAAVTIRPTTERALALLRRSKITCYFPRGYPCYFRRRVVARRSTAATKMFGSSPIIPADMGGRSHEPSLGLAGRRRGPLGRPSHVAGGNDHQEPNRMSGRPPRITQAEVAPHRSSVEVGRVSQSRPFPRRGLSRTEAAMYLGLSPSKFDELRKADRIAPPKVLDGRLIFTVERLDEFLDSLPDESQASNDEWTASL